MAMLQAALKTNRTMHFIHAARHGGVHAFRGAIDALAARHPQLKRFYCYEERRDGDAEAHALGYVDETNLRKWLPETRDVDVYFLGPVAFVHEGDQERPEGDRRAGIAVSSLGRLPRSNNALA